jgi:hypothetical protein
MARISLDNTWERARKWVANVLSVLKPCWTNMTQAIAPINNTSHAQGEEDAASALNDADLLGRAGDLGYERHKKDRRSDAILL